MSRHARLHSHRCHSAVGGEARQRTSPSHAPHVDRLRAGRHRATAAPAYYEHQHAIVVLSGVAKAREQQEIEGHRATPHHRRGALRAAGARAGQPRSGRREDGVAGAGDYRPGVCMKAGTAVFDSPSPFGLAIIPQSEYHQPSALGGGVHGRVRAVVARALGGSARCCGRQGKPVDETRACARRGSSNEWTPSL